MRRRHLFWTVGIFSVPVLLIVIMLHLNTAITHRLRAEERGTTTPTTENARILWEMQACNAISTYVDLSRIETSIETMRCNAIAEAQTLGFT